MTLIYTDRNGDGRLQPTVDAIDVQGNPKAHNTTSFSPRAVGTQTNAKLITKDSNIIAFDGSHNIGLFGFDNTGTMVVKVAKSGFDADTAGNANLIFNSQQDMLKIVSNGMQTATIPSDSTSSTSKTTTLTIAHGLSFTPILLAFIVDFRGGYTPLPSFKSIGTLQRNFSSPNNGIVLALNQFIHGATDGTNIYFYNDFANDSYPSTYSTSATVVNYYLLQETAN